MTLRNRISTTMPIAIFALFIIISLLLGFRPGNEIAHNFISFSAEMFKVLPCAFIFIGLFETWVKKEQVEKHLGTSSGYMGYLWSVLLAGSTVGGLYVAFPVASSLYRKGAKLGVVFTYVGASAICRIPMTIFESSFLGIKFSMIRLLISIPLVIITSIWLGHYLEKRGYRIIEGR